MPLLHDARRLIATLEDLIRRRDNGRVPPFARLVIETTGLADPAPILNTILFHPYLPMRYRIDSVVTVVDALHGARDAWPTRRRCAGRRCRHADPDQDGPAAGPGDRAAPAATTLRQLNPGARVLDAEAGEASPRRARRRAFSLESRPGAVRAGSIRYARYEDHDHGHDHARSRT